jgi:FAD/FMN-containing dehydrogenase
MAGRQSQGSLGVARRARAHAGGMNLHTTISRSRPRFDAIRDLEAHLLGELIRPAHDDYDAARKVHNLGVDRHPALILRAADAADVIRGVTFAREHELPLAVRSGGHSMAGHGTVDGGLVIDLGRMQGLSIDPETRVAWAQPGVRWGTYAQQADAFALGTTSGDTSSVGIGGLTLGGGIGWMVRKYGLTIDNLLSVELVTADGRLLRVTAEDHPDLFWALRGGGGNFGVATAFQFRLHRAGLILGGAIVYPAERNVLRGWAEYAINAPDELTSMAYIMKAPPAPFIPAEWVGRDVAIIGVCYVGDIHTGNRVVQPLRTLGQPVVDITTRMPYPGLFQLSEEATHPQPFGVRSGFMDSVPDAAIDRSLAYVQDLPAGRGLVQFRALGGALARVPADATAFAHRARPYMLTVEGNNEESDAPARAWSDLLPYTRGVYSNFLGDEGQERVREAYSPPTFERLLSIKRQCDPTNLFSVNPNIR